MNNYTVTLTDTEKSAMEYVAYEPQEWIENAFKQRAKIAIDEIVKIAVEKFLEIKRGNGFDKFFGSLINTNHTKQLKQIKLSPGNSA